MSLFSSLKRTSQRRKLFKHYKTLIGRTDRIALINAEEIAILLDELEIHKYEPFIPTSSIHIPAVKPGRITLGRLILLVGKNREHDRPANKGVPVHARTIGLKCRETGLIQETSP